MTTAAMMRASTATNAPATDMIGAALATGWRGICSNRSCLQTVVRRSHVAAGSDVSARKVCLGVSRIERVII